MSSNKVLVVYQYIWGHVSFFSWGLFSWLLAAQPTFGPSPIQVYDIILIVQFTILSSIIYVLYFMLGFKINIKYSNALMCIREPRRFLYNGARTLLIFPAPFSPYLFASNYFEDLPLSFIISIGLMLLPLLLLCMSVYFSKIYYVNIKEVSISFLPERHSLSNDFILVGGRKFHVEKLTGAKRLVKHISECHE